MDKNPVFTLNKHTILIKHVACLTAIINCQTKKLKQYSEVD